VAEGGADAGEKFLPAARASLVKRNRMDGEAAEKTHPRRSQGRIKKSAASGVRKIAKRQRSAYPLSARKKK